MSWNFWRNLKIFNLTEYFDIILIACGMRNRNDWWKIFLSRSNIFRDIANELKFLEEPQNLRFVSGYTVTNFRDIMLYFFFQLMFKSSCLMWSRGQSFAAGTGKWYLSSSRQAWLLASSMSPKVKLLLTGWSDLLFKYCTKLCSCWCDIIFI